MAANEASLAVGIESMSPPRCVVAGSIGFCQQHATGGCDILQVPAGAGGVMVQSDVERVIHCVAQGARALSSGSPSACPEASAAGGPSSGVVEQHGASRHPSDSPSLSIGQVKIGTSVEAILRLDAALAQLPKEGKSRRVLAVLCQGKKWEEMAAGDRDGDRRKRSRTQGQTSMSDAKKLFETKAAQGTSAGASSGAGS